MLAVKFFLSGVCHQIPDHCLCYQGQPLPLCARCMGTFLGVVIALVTLRLIGQGRRSELPSWRIGLVLVVMVGLWGLDGLNSFLSLPGGTRALYEPSNSLRLATGMGSGLAVGIVLYPIYHFAMWRRVDERRVLDHAWQVVVLLAAGAICATIILLCTSVPYVLVVTIATGVVAVVFTIVNALLVVLLRNKEGFAERWVEIVPYLVGGFVASLLETGILAFGRRLLVN